MQSGPARTTSDSTGLEAASKTPPGHLATLALGFRVDGVARDLFQDPEFATIVERDIREGQHRNPTGRLDYFTTAHFHRPEDLPLKPSRLDCVLMGYLG